MNYFVEGLQGSGKSTLVEKISKKYPGYTAFHEGDYSPIELAWCACVTTDEYAGILDKYSDIRTLMEEKSQEENSHMMMPGSKGFSHVKLACKWGKSLLTRPYMSK